MSEKDPIEPGLRQFVRRHVDSDDLAFAPIVAGRNNQGWKVTTGAQTFFLKRYFPSPARDRLQSEWVFLEYALGCGVKNIPRPLARDEAERVILFEFVSGSRFDGCAIGETEVLAALELVNQLNPPDRSVRGPALPDASDACFSFAEHADHVLRRIATLKHELSSGTEDLSGWEFVSEILEPGVNRAVSILRDHASSAGRDWSARIPDQRRVASPSDFGFHNALRTADGTIVFLDFEYAGWDDPLKVVCDFFAQPDCPVPVAFLDLFFGSFVGLSDARADTAWVRALLPLYVAKWACIMLNPLLHSFRQRLNFAARGEPPALIVKRAVSYFERHRSEAA